MNNVLLDPLPDTWADKEGNVYELDTDFRIGIQICLIQEDPDLSNREKNTLMCGLLFKETIPMDAEEIMACMNHYLYGWNHDKPPKKEEHTRLMDFDVDQWRIFSAFWSQYRINLNEATIHWWQFMGMLSALNECAYTRVIDIRQRKFKSKMDKDERKALRDAKEVYALDEVLTQEEKAFSNDMDDLLGVSAGERSRIENFERYADADEVV